MKYSIFWFRRDLRIEDNHGLYKALNSGYPVIPVFIFDTNILQKLSADDKRMPFIHQELVRLSNELESYGNKLLIFHGTPEEVFRSLSEKLEVNSVFVNKDYEPYAKRRDSSIKELLAAKEIGFESFTDQVIFEPGEIVKADGSPYEVYTPFSKKWLTEFRENEFKATPFEVDTSKLRLGVQNSPKTEYTSIPSLTDLGFKESTIRFPEREIDTDLIRNYSKTRDFPYMDGTTKLGLHLRFGTISIRQCVKVALENSDVWLNELIWREFFMNILAFYPRVESMAFKEQYDRIKWINDEDQFRNWCEGKTGYPIVDAGMRQMKLTGFMHNRVRMIAGSFLVKHLLIDWRWGETWFAQHLLDYELSSNNGNWQWVAGSGCDAAPYFRIFNPVKQQEKFDPQFRYIRQWVPEFGTPDYSVPIIDHEFARDRCIQAYKKAVIM